MGIIERKMTDKLRKEIEEMGVNFYKGCKCGKIHLSPTDVERLLSLIKKERKRFALSRLENLLEYLSTYPNGNKAVTESTIRAKIRLLKKEECSCPKDSVRSDCFVHGIGNYTIESTKEAIEGK